MLFPADVERAAERGDREALFQLAQWRLLGTNGPRDLESAHALLARAGAVGHVGAIRMQAILKGNGTGCSSDPQAAAALLERIRAQDAYAELQLTFTRTKMLSEEDAARLPVERLAQRPDIRAIRGLFTPAECHYLTTMAEPHLEASYVIDPATGARMPHPVRTSSGMSFGPFGEDLVIHTLNRRLALVTGTDVGCGEPLHILRYAPGEQYLPHVDALPGLRNQRHWTVLVYLNDGYSGGETRFDLAGVTFAGRAGDALIFRNVDAEGRSDPASRHAGLAVTSGAKWLATRWIRAAPYHPWTSAD
ncbi:MAG TPA: 2OG-Fe(II) oxygenase [Allosphingosinicella sp.]|jgi:prolyl 4-hydroxylase